jgi:hypothetical protein
MAYSSAFREHIHNTIVVWQPAAYALKHAS